MLIQARRGRCRKGQLVPRNMIRMRVRHKAPRLPTPYIDPELRERQE
jgi:hypothetical protein